MRGAILKSKKGFTLIEIIVVLVVLAILAVASIPTMMGFVEEAEGKVYIVEARIGYIAAQAVATEMVAEKGFVPDEVDLRDNEMFKSMTAELSADLNNKFDGFAKPVYTSEGKIIRMDYVVTVGRKRYVVTLEAGKPAIVKKSIDKL